MNTTKHALGDRVLVRHITAPLPRNGRSAIAWLPGELISAESWYGRERYVALLDDGRRLVAFDDHVREVPRWESVSSTEIEVLREICEVGEIAAA